MHKRLWLMLLFVLPAALQAQIQYKVKIINTQNQPVAGYTVSMALPDRKIAENTNPSGIATFKLKSEEVLAVCKYFNEFVKISAYGKQVRTLSEESDCEQNLTVAKVKQVANTYFCAVRLQNTENTHLKDHEVKITIGNNTYRGKTDLYGDLKVEMPQEEQATIESLRDLNTFNKHFEFSYNSKPLKIVSAKPHNSSKSTFIFVVEPFYNDANKEKPQESQKETAKETEKVPQKEEEQAASSAEDRSQNLPTQTPAERESGLPINVLPAQNIEKETQKIENTIQDIKAQNQDLVAKITDIEKRIKEDKNLSVEEKKSLEDELARLRKQLYLQQLALVELNRRLADLQASFWVRYRNTLIIFGLVTVALSIVIYLLWLLAKMRRKERDILAEKNEEIKQRNEEISAQRDEIEHQRSETEKLLLNILPAPIARELQATGKVIPQSYPAVTALFTDFQGFSTIAKNLTASEVVEKLDYYFNEFERISLLFGLEKIKTMGDAFMAVAGVPIQNPRHAIDAVCAALQMQDFISRSVQEKIALGESPWYMRIGLHTGELVAGVIGKTKFAYDIWGNTVNLAARMESSGEGGKVQISEFTYALVKDYFDCTPRGIVEAKNIGKVQTYYVNRLLPEYAENEQGFEPNAQFWNLHL